LVFGYTEKCIGRNKRLAGVFPQEVSATFAMPKEMAGNKQIRFSGVETAPRVLAVDLTRSSRTLHHCQRFLVRKKRTECYRTIALPTELRSISRTTGLEPATDSCIEVSLFFAMTKFIKVLAREQADSDAGFRPLV